MAMDLDDRVVEVDQCQVVDPGEQRRLLGERGEEPGRDCARWRTWPNVNGRRKLPRVDGA
jgi:hypothetical protein